MNDASSCIGPTLLQPICQGLGGIGSSIFSAGASAALDALSGWVATGSAWLLGQIGAALDATTKVSLGSPWFVDRYQSMEGLLALFALPLLVASAIQAIFQQRAGILVRAALIQLPLAMVLTGAAVELTSMALATTDQLSAAVSGASSGELGSLTGSLASVLVNSTTATGSAVPTFITMLCAAVVALAALVLWVELVLRSAAIYVVVLFLPLALACSIWPALTGWSRRLVETLVALILSKLVVVVVLVAALGALGEQAQRGFATIITGIALLVLATFAPFSLFKMLPLFEASAAMHLEGLRQRASSTVQHGVPRQAATMALDRAAVTPPLATSAALGALGTARRAVAQLDEVGVRSTESPMGSSAVSRGGSAGGRDGAAPVHSSPGEEMVGRGAVGRPEVGSSPQMAGAQTPTASPRTPSGQQRGSSRPASELVIERDALGPIIRGTRPGQDADER
jgi:hypothetical protein